MSWHNSYVPIGRDAQEVTSTGGGSIGREEAKDVSEEDAACTRDAHGPTEPEIPALSPPRTAREFEQALRALGYSKRQAAAIAARGFKCLAEAEPSEDVSEELAALLKRNLDMCERNPS
jgi:hypothetical protein